MFTKLIIVFLLFFNAVSFASVQTSLKLTDRCNAKETSLYSANGLYYEIKITGLRPNQLIPVIFEYFYNYQPSEFINQSELVYRTKLRTNNDGEINTYGYLPNSKTLRRAEKVHNGSASLWTLRVRWNDGRRGDVVQKDFFRLKEHVDFYQIVSEDLCHYETSPKISSTLRVNRTRSIMTINRAYLSFEESISQRG